MRSYLILADKAARFDTDPDIAEALATAQAARLHEPQVDWRDPGALVALRAERFDEAALAAQGYGNERLDQLVNELLLGVR